jgi:hypothetical protein
VIARSGWACRCGGRLPDDPEQLNVENRRDSFCG